MKNYILYFLLSTSFLLGQINDGNFKKEVSKGFVVVKFTAEWSAKNSAYDDGVLGKTSIDLISDENPYGLDSNDPNSKDDILVMDADLHLKINQPVKVELRSFDVLHNFYVPQFRAKMDTLPGIITYYWFTPEKTGKFEILCAEYCGTGHYAMRGYVQVDEEKDYSNWLAKQITFEKMFAKNSGKKLLVAENKN